MSKQATGNRQQQTENRGMSFSGARCLLPGASRAQRGFTLVEMIDAIGLFAVVMIVCVGALLSLVHANRKAQALQSVMNNLNIALDGMVRSIRMGNDYRCDALNPEDGDCPTGGRSFYFESFVGQSNTTGDGWIYFYDAAAQRIYKSTDGSLLSGIPLTAPEVSIDEMLIYEKRKNTAKGLYSHRDACCGSASLHCGRSPDVACIKELELRSLCARSDHFLLFGARSDRGAAQYPRCADPPDRPKRKRCSRYFRAHPAR